MADEKRAALVKRLLEQTIAGKLPWEETADENLFQVAFPNYVIIVAKRIYEGEASHYVLLRNPAGKVMDTIGYEDLEMPFENPVQLLQELFDNARRHATGVDAAIDQILSDLDDNT